MGEPVTKWAVIKADNTVENLTFNFIKPEAINLGYILGHLAPQAANMKSLIKDGEVYIVKFGELLEAYEKVRVRAQDHAETTINAWVESNDYRRSY